MMKTKLILLVMVLAAGHAYTQAANDSLFRVLKTQDSLLFNVGFNQCQVAMFEKLVSTDFEFYHDKGGPTTSKAEFVSSIKNGLCAMDYKAMRKLGEASLKVFPLTKNGMLYGAIQSGAHSFYALQPGKPDELTSTALFTHLWLLENGEWKLSRGLSYDHQPPPASKN